MNEDEKHFLSLELTKYLLIFMNHLSGTIVTILFGNTCAFCRLIKEIRYCRGYCIKLIDNIVR